MKIVYLKRDKIYLPLNGYSTEVCKNNTLRYFVYGIGHKKTKSFSILPDEMPEKWEKTITWLDVAKIHERYGIHVATYYAESKTAGIVARQTAKSYFYLYSKIKHLIDEDFKVEFFECLCCDYMLSNFGLFMFDIVATDKRLAARDPDYDSNACTYKGRTGISMRIYVALSWGKKYEAIIDALLDAESSALTESSQAA